MFLKVAILVCLHLMVDASTKETLEFPKTFKFGVATSSYQIEGAWNVSGKTQSIWDYYTHTFPKMIRDGSNGDIACDSYNQLDVDIENLKLLNVNFYRFSLNWPRLLPNGGDTFINPDGVRYYNELIDKLIKNGIEPMITLYHWELPQSIQDLGGWTNRITIDYFQQFARVAFKLFGDRVKTWITTNELFTSCFYGYETPLVAPFVTSPGIGAYLCGHNQLLAHAAAYHIYQSEFKKKQRGEVGITLDTPWYQAKSTKTADQKAASRAMDFHFNWFAHPIFSKKGDYPEVMKTVIAYNSKKQGYHQSRLPKFTRREIRYLRGTADFLGLNHYTSSLITPMEDQSPSELPRQTNDVGIVESADPSWNSTSRVFFKVNPNGLRSLLKYIKDKYNNPKVYITENGYAGEWNESTNDTGRIWYIQGYLNAVLEAIHLDRCNVQAYTAWSFMDNYEWSDGYNMRFGLFHVDFEDPKRKRTPKDSVYVYRDIINNRHV